MGSPSTAAGPVKNVMWPILYGVSGMLPLGFSCACATPTAGMTDPADAVSAAPTLTLKVLRKSRRFTSPAIFVPPLGSLRVRWETPVPPRVTPGLTDVKTPGDFVTYNRFAGSFVPAKSHGAAGRRSDRNSVGGGSPPGGRPSAPPFFPLPGGLCGPRLTSPPPRRPPPCDPGGAFPSTPGGQV